MIATPEQVQDYINGEVRWDIGQSLQADQEAIVAYITKHYVITRLDHLGQEEAELTREDFDAMVDDYYAQDTREEAVSGPLAHARAVDDLYEALGQHRRAESVLNHFGAEDYRKNYERGVMFVLREAMSA